MCANGIYKCLKISCQVSKKLGKTEVMAMFQTSLSLPGLNNEFSNIKMAINTLSHHRLYSIYKLLPKSYQNEYTLQ